jgi:hypothetical protein
MVKTPSAVSSLLFRGRKALHEKLSQDTIDGER